MSSNSNSLASRQPRLIPVIDILDGQVVRAVAGRRQEYRPIESPLVSGSDPFIIAGALLDRTGAEELYIADLDSILGRVNRSHKVVDLIHRLPVKCWVDFGIRDRTTVTDWQPPANLAWIWGSETVTREQIRDFRQLGNSTTGAFSIDLQAGRLMGDWESWGIEDSGQVMTLVRQVVDLGFRTLIVLDLHRVGGNAGPGTAVLCQQIRQEFPDIELIAGGGIRDSADVQLLGDSGADAVLVATALHSGSISPSC